jgi:hypothetical protein
LLIEKKDTKGRGGTDDVDRVVIYLFSYSAFDFVGLKNAIK